MSIRPRSLPKLRDQALRHLTDPTMPVRALTGEQHQAGLDMAAKHLRAAALYWVTPDMTALAMSAGASLAAARWATADRPSGCGLLMWEGGIGGIDRPPIEIPVEAASWGPSPDGCLIWLWMSRARLEKEISRNPTLQIDAEQVPALIPLVGFTLPVTAEPVPLVDLPPIAPAPIVAALAAAWLLMHQPNLVERTTEKPDKSVRRAYGRAGRESPEVSIIDLRHQYVPNQDGGDEPSERRYKYRWVVSGHWRNQAHGPDHSMRRRQWIPSYTKGPDGAPLLITEKVNVWRR